MVIASKNLSTETMSQLSMAKDNHYTLHYFPFHGVVPAARAMLALSGEKYSFEHPVDWAQEKFQAPLGSLPILYQTTKTGETLELFELSVIEHHLAEKFGFLGTNAWEANQVKMYHSSTQALFDKLVTTVVRAPKELQDQMLQRYLDTILPEWVTYHEKHLQANGANGHYFGTSCTLADLKLATILDNIMTVSKDKAIISREKTPAIMAVYDAVEKMPKYAALKASEQWKEYSATSLRLFGF